VKINQGDVPATVNGQPFFGTYVSVVKTTNPLPTSLDWYGIDGYKAGAFEFVSDPEVTFNNPVLTGVCISYDDAIVTSPNDIRLAHTAPANPAEVVAGNYVVTTAGGSIEIAAPFSAAPLGLACQPLPCPVGQRVRPRGRPGRESAAAAVPVRHHHRWFNRWYGQEVQPVRRRRHEARDQQHQGRRHRSTSRSMPRPPRRP
jgi:hypothetical protein